MFIRGFAVLAVVLALCCAPARAQEQSFAAFEAELWPDAQAKGITRATFDLALKGVTPDPRVIAATKRQPEYGKPVGAYVNAIVSRGRIANGQRKAKEWAKTFDAVEKKFGVERWVLIALWGMETDYGAEKDRWDVFRSLATLGYVRYRHPYFRNELIVAMRIMQDGHFARDKMVSSWAGAMGQTQFMPTNVVDYAIDFSGDGKSRHLDQCAGRARLDRQLSAQGELEARPALGLRGHRAEGLRLHAQPRQLRGMGEARRAPRRRQAVPAVRPGHFVFPSGANGPAFIATENYAVLKEYNNSDAYAIAVGHLADRINGGAPIKAAWPADDRPLSRDARIALQKKLSALGYKVLDFEGHVDFDLRDNIRAEQAKLGMVPDGNPTAAFLEKLGVKVP